MGIENVKNIKKNKRNLLLFGGEIQNLGGEISPPKGPEKNTTSFLKIAFSKVAEEFF